MSKTIKPQASCKIAVIGLGCVYPGARSPLELWENILARRRQFREMPDVRLPNKEYFDPYPLALNKSYQNKAAVIDGYEFNWVEKRIPKQTFESTDIVHWLALDTALQAIADAGFDKGSIPVEKTGVILGNTLTGEFTRSNQMLLRWPYVRKALRESAQKRGMAGMAMELEATMEQYYKSVFHPVTEDTLAGGLANTIAGRICNFLDFHGGGYIVDGACSSSLLAIITAANYLELNQMDMAIAGGVDISLDTFELIGFAKTNALTPDEMRVYDKNGKGFLPGEGCGMVVMKRLEDAVRDNNQIYAIIDGWGISSDGKGGITAPSVLGQSRALIRSREKAQISPLQFDFIEGHGTGTTVGDKVELEAISVSMNNEGEIPFRNCGVTSFKSIVGHTKAAAGIGAFIKAVVAVNRRILPPTAGLKDPNPVFNDKARSLYPIIHGQVKSAESILYAGVSAMGFGGINSHVILHSGDAPSHKLKPVIEEKKLMTSSQSHELFLFTASDKSLMIETLLKARENTVGISYAEMADFAFFQNSITDHESKFRAAIIADTPFELERKINLLIEKLKSWNETGFLFLENNTISAGYKKADPIIGAVFPGQGSQKINMARKLSDRYDWIRSKVETAGEIFIKEGATNVLSSIFRETDRTVDNDQLLQWQNELKQTDVAQPAITLASLLWYEYLKQLGIKIRFVAGHSLGELMAFYAAGLLSEESLLRFSAFRGKSMAKSGSGIMASLQCSEDVAKKYIDKTKGYVTIANKNGHEQTVISGESESIKEIVQMAQKDQVGAVELPVSAAFHSQLIAEVAIAIEACDLLKEKRPKDTSVTLISSVSGNEITEGTDLNTYFSNQAISQVDFISTVNAMSEHCDNIIEIGPGKILSGLITNISGSVKAFPVEKAADDDLSLNVMLGNIFVSGGDIKTDELYRNRLIRNFIPAREKHFLVNPLERPFPDFNESHTVQTNSLAGMLNLNSDNDFNNYLIERSSFIREIIDADYKYFKKIHVEDLLPQDNVDSVEQLIQPSSAGPVLKNVPDTSKLLYQRIHEMTGFDPKSFNDQMRLLDDFNLDSIKATALLNGLSKSLAITGKINPALFSNSTLKEISDTISKIVDSAETVVAIDQKAEKNSAVDIVDWIYEDLATRTGFPREALSGDHKLLDDLNMDSIKAGAFISQVLKKYNIRRNGGPGLANASINEIIKIISEAADIEEIKSGLTEAVSPSWVNAYSVVVTEEPLSTDTNLYNEFWKDGSLVIVHSEEDTNRAKILKDQIKPQVSGVICVSGSDFHLLTSFERSCILVLMPDAELTGKNIEVTVKLLADTVQQIDKISMLGFLQFNDGLFLRGTTGGNHNCTCFGVVSFAASLHHERPDLKIRVIETDRKMPLAHGVAAVMKEFAGETAFDAAGYDISGVRRKMKYQLLPDESGKVIQYKPGPDDVVIATGGARGITAECMFSLAKKTGCKTALIGSSPLSGEAESILDRYKSGNLIARYYVCDISDPSMVNETVRLIQHDLGSITGVLHGAGRNIPRRAEKVKFEEAISEISPKLSGFINLSEALKDSDIRFYIALTSIIGITGMPGNSWYAFSNENLDLYIRSMFLNPGTFVRTLAYSIWDEIGMGARMGSNQLLSEMGIASIKPALGIGNFLYWAEHQNTDQQIVVSSKMGDLDTWNVMKPVLRANRFISDVRKYEPGREFSARVKLNKKTDLYLQDHNYSGSLLFPTVFGLEAMAQASCYLARVSEISGLTIENILLVKPIVVPHDGDIEIEVSARLMEQDPELKSFRIFAGISTEDSNFKNLHFSAEYMIHLKAEKIDAPVKITDKFLNISPQSDLYSWLLFQGRGFQHIENICELDNDRVDFKTGVPETDPATVSYSVEVSSPMIAGNPLLRDVLLQSVQLYLTKKKYLPVKIKRWEIFDIGRQGNGGTVLSRLSEIKEDRAICNVGFISDDQVIERITGYEVKALGLTPDYPDAKTLADLQVVISNAVNSEFSRYEPFLDSRIYHALHKHNEEFNKINSDARHELEQDVFQTFISGVPDVVHPCKIVWAANGKPSIENSDLKLSVSHSQSVLFMTAGNEEQGCDIEFVSRRTREEWDNLLENKFSAVLEQLRAIDSNNDISSTRIWCVKEALIKSFGLIPLNISIEKVIQNGIIFKTLTANGENKMVLTFPVEFLPENTAVISMVVSLKKEDISPDKAAIPANADYHKGTGAFSDIFLTTFRDCRGFFGKTHFTSFIDWMGALRELVLAPIGTELLDDLSSGRYGMVTNSSEIHVRQEAGTLDEITGKLWITNQSDLHNSVIDLNFAFYKKEHENRVLLASCSLSTTWVSIEGRGIVRKSPIPRYFMEFLNAHISIAGMDTDLINPKGYPVTADMGELVYNNTLPRPELKLHESDYKTGLTHGNTVGNLYYSNYYTWQSRMIEDYLYQHVPEIMTDGGRSGEFLTLYSNVNHLQEAMPFEVIIVSMYVNEYCEKGIKFYFEYHCLHGKQKRKLAYGNNMVVFCKRTNEKSFPVIQAIPDNMAREFQKAILELKT